jgi:hypothetical protein
MRIFVRKNQSDQLLNARRSSRIISLSTSPRPSQLSSIELENESHLNLVHGPSK